MRSNGRVLRLLDANVNRFCEGCRVVEDYLRFLSASGAAMERVRGLRRRLRDAVRRRPDLAGGLLAARDTASDPGAGAVFDRANLRRASAEDVAVAGLKRMQESARVLEEYAKVACPDLAALFKRLRFESYDLERTLFVGRKRR